MSDDELREALAAIEHDQWVEWSQTIVREGLTDNRITRWASYWRPYAELDEATKDHDRKWADRVLAALSSPETTPAGVLDEAAILMAALGDVTAAYHHERKHEGHWSRCQHPRCQNARLATEGRGPFASLPTPQTPEEET